MNPRVCRLIVCLLSLLPAVTGCQARRTTATPQHWAPPTIERTAAALPTENSPPSTTRFDVQHAASLEEFAQALDQAHPPAEFYLRMTPEECAARAASVAPAGELLEWEAAAARQVSQSGPGNMRHLAALQLQILTLRQQERELQAATDALARFYQLADAHVQLAAIGQSLHTIAAMLADAERIERVTGNQVPQKRVFETQSLELRDRQATLATQVASLNDQLRAALAIPPSDRRGIWPMVDGTLRAEPIDLDAAVAAALARRPELESLRIVASNLNGTTLPAARMVLGREDPALGAIAVPNSAQNSPYAAYEVQVRERQLAVALAAAERRTIAEVNAAAAQLNTASLHAVRTKDVRLRRTDDLRLLERKAEIAPLSTFELGEARLAVIRAEAEMRHEILEQRIAAVRLQAAVVDLLEDGALRPGPIITHD